MEWRLGVGGAWWFIGRFVAFRSKGRGSNPALAVMCGHWASPSLAVSCCASTRNSDTVSVLCRVRLWVVVDLKRRYRNIRNERVNGSTHGSGCWVNDLSSSGFPLTFFVFPFTSEKCPKCINFLCVIIDSNELRPKFLVRIMDVFRGCSGLKPTKWIRSCYKSLKGIKICSNHAIEKLPIQNSQYIFMGTSLQGRQSPISCIFSPISKSFLKSILFPENSEMSPLFSFNLRFCFPPILPMMHLRIMLYTCWTPLRPWSLSEHNVLFSAVIETLPTVTSGCC